MALLNSLTQWKQNLLSNLQRVRTLRFAIGVTFATGLAYSIAWPLSFLLPVLSVVLLAMPIPRLSLKQGIINMRDTLVGFMVGVLFTLFILPYPIIYIPLLGLALYHIYYYLNRGGSFWLVLLTLLSILLMPMLASIHGGLALGVALGFVWSGWLTIALLWLAHYLVPDPPGGAAIPAKPGFQPGYSAPAAELALKSVIVVLPIVLLFIANNWTDQMMVMLFAAIISLSPDIAKSAAAGLNSIKSTLIGGGAAFFFYWGLVAVPEYHFLILQMFLFSLVFGALINSDKPIAKYLGSAMVAMFLLVNGSLGEGADFTEKFLMRVIYISMAVLYVVTALKILTAYWPKRIDPSSAV